MNSKILLVTAAVIIAVAAISVVVYFTSTETNEGSTQLDPEEDFLNSSGPFALDKFTYRLGENVFLKVDGLTSEDVGSIIYFRPNDAPYVTYPIDGNIKPSFNKYFTPDLNAVIQICTIEDLVGTWTVAFQGTVHQPLKFEVIEEYLDGEEEDYEPAC